MSLLFPIGLFCLAFILLVGFVQINKLIAFEQAHYPDEWQSDGCPEGFFNFKFRLAGRDTSTSGCAFSWLFLTPNWVRRHEQPTRWLRGFRLCALLWNLGILLLVFVAVPRYAPPAHTANTYTRTQNQP